MMFQFSPQINPNGRNDGLSQCLGRGWGLKTARRALFVVENNGKSVAQECCRDAFGHRTFDATSDLYAPFSPDYLGNALKVVESVCDEIQNAVPNAFYRTFTALKASLKVVGGSKSG
jgi:hypothetical protein